MENTTNANEKEEFSCLFVNMFNPYKNTSQGFARCFIVGEKKRFGKHDRNEVYDDIMDKYIDALKKQLN